MRTKIMTNNKVLHLVRTPNSPESRTAWESICIMHICMPNGDWVLHPPGSDAMRKLIRIHSPIVHEHSPNGHNSETYLPFVFLSFLFSIIYILNIKCFLPKTEIKKEKKKIRNKFMLNCWKEINKNSSFFCDSEIMAQVVAARCLKCSEWGRPARDCICMPDVLLLMRDAFQFHSFEWVASQQARHRENG